MIEVLIPKTGDRAEAETPEAAVLAARTLVREADTRCQGWASGLEVHFYADGKLVRVMDGKELAS